MLFLKKKRQKEKGLVRRRTSKVRPCGFNCDCKVSIDILDRIEPEA